MQREIESKEKELAVLRNQNATLRAESAANAKRLATLESRLIRMEMSIPPARRPVANTVAENNGANEK
jgi:septal ring factor EnvC (AmiA/AmiB activator)